MHQDESCKNTAVGVNFFFSVRFVVHLECGILDHIIIFANEMLKILCFLCLLLRHICIVSLKIVHVIQELHPTVHLFDSLSLRQRHT